MKRLSFKQRNAKFTAIIQLDIMMVNSALRNGNDRTAVALIHRCRRYINRANKQRLFGKKKLGQMLAELNEADKLLKVIKKEAALARGE